MDFNINNKVRVKLTDYGRQALARQHNGLKEDAEGWSEWQLWHLMQELGHLCCLGCQVPFETTIQLLEVKPWTPMVEDPMSAVRSMCE